MLSRRSVLTGLSASAVSLVTGCAERSAYRYRPQSPVIAHAPSPLSSVPVTGLDAVIDINHSAQVSDFMQARQRNNILGVMHKASEGGNWTDPLYRQRQAQAAAAGLMWGGYHFGTRQYSGAQQASAYLALVQPTPQTLMALDLEPNERSPQNTMNVAQAEDFVSTIYQATRRLPLIYVHPKWANGGPYGKSGLKLDQPISPNSILASCDLWLADYRPTPEVPAAWAGRGWRLWQYAGDNSKGGGGALGYLSQQVAGINRCDRNMFCGDAGALYRYWQGLG